MAIGFGARDYEAALHLSQRMHLPRVVIRTFFIVAVERRAIDLPCRRMVAPREERTGLAIRTDPRSVLSGKRLRRL